MSFKQKLSVVLLILFFLTFSTISYAQSFDKSQIVVNACSKISILPDSAKLNIDIRSEKSTVNEAQKSSNEKVTKVINALSRLGIKKENISTSDFTITPEYAYDYKIVSSERRIKSYIAQYTLTVSVNDLNLVGKIIDTSIVNGASNTYDIEYFSSKYNEIYLEALANASKLAQKKANVLAESAGVKIDKIATIEEIRNYSLSRNYKSSYNYDEEINQDNGMKVISANIIIQAEINVSYLLK